MSNIESPKIIKNFFVVSALFATGFVFLNTVEKISENIYNSKKNNLERKFGSILNKKVKLGNYGGLSLLGFSLDNSEILDKELEGSYIKSKKIFRTTTSTTAQHVVAKLFSKTPKTFVRVQLRIKTLIITFNGNSIQANCSSNGMDL